MLFLQGSDAYTTFRLQQLQTQLQLIFPPLKEIKATYIYFIDPTTSLDETDKNRITALLPHSKWCQPAELTPLSDFYVVPRLGTISPWSSKATDIAHNCELEKILRIERGISYKIFSKDDIPVTKTVQTAFIQKLHDPLTESILFSTTDFEKIFLKCEPKSYEIIPLMKKGIDAINQANQRLGLALNSEEIQYLFHAFQKLQRDPTDVELMMFAQINSEHCRHKIFNAQWFIDHQLFEKSLFSMIRHTHATNPGNVLVAYRDNAAVIQGRVSDYFFIDSAHQYHLKKEPLHIVFKVETHNHPTAISPYAGAATGSGGEIRDEAATGRGAQTCAGLMGFSVSHLHLPGFAQPWEKSLQKPAHFSSALEIMLQGPIGAAAFNNEFGRPAICGYFRVFEMSSKAKIHYGYHKPIMIAGGLGHIRESQVHKKALPAETLLIVLGGPAMAIGLGGGSASSLIAGHSHRDLDFASVQRANPEMQRRAQEVINACIAMGEQTPILSIHDVGAGGLANALPELVQESLRGANIELRDIPNAEPGMSPLAIWCNESQERFVLAIEKRSLELFTKIAQRERCLFSVVGTSAAQKELKVTDSAFKNIPINLPLSLLFEDVSRLTREDKTHNFSGEKLNTAEINLSEAVKRVLQYPAVADKSFLITIGDRTVGGLIARDQMVGPWQIPVADVGVIADDFTHYTGQAVAIGERAPLATINAAAAARMAVGEAITNIAAAPIENLSHIVLSANWMAAANCESEGVHLYEAVKTVALELCPALGVCIPVGKDSLSMQTLWQDKQGKQDVRSPLSLIISATAPVSDIRAVLTPQLQTAYKNTRLILIDLSQGRNALGGSCLAQTYNLITEPVPDVDNPERIKNFFKAIQLLNPQLLAYHDRSDGGLLATTFEMAFAGRTGLTLCLDELGNDPIAALFSEELGAVIQVKNEDVEAIFSLLKIHELAACSYLIGVLNSDDQLKIEYKNKTLFSEKRSHLHRWWSETSYRLRLLRDNPDCVQQEYDQLLQKEDKGLFSKLTFSLTENVVAPYIHKKIRPRIAILREQGVNGHREMAAAFHFAGFDSVDVHMSDLLEGRMNLLTFNGLAACGGFSYGDVLGAGRGWAQSILMHLRLRDSFAQFFESKDRFALGICNGCQMLSQLKDLIPGAKQWPRFVSNESAQFEARLSMVKIPKSPSIFFNGMHDSLLPIVVAHGEGRVEFSNENSKKALASEQLIALHYIDSSGNPTKNYPNNPNGSLNGITGLTNRDGRITLLMPHPERVFRSAQFSWHPPEWGERSPWARFFENARAWVD